MIDNALRAYFGREPEQQGKGYQYTLAEEGSSYRLCTSADAPEGNVITIFYTEDNEVRLMWHRDGLPIVHVQRIEMERVVPIREDDEEMLQFVLARMSSRMIQIQLKPSFAVEFGLFWEFCDECD